MTNENNPFSAHNDLDYLYEIILDDYNIKEIDNNYYKNISDKTLISNFENDKWDEKYFKDILKIITEKYPLISCDYKFSNSYVDKIYLNSNNIKDIIYLSSKNDHSDELEYENKIDDISEQAFKLLQKYMSSVGENIQKKDFSLFSDFEPNKPLKLYRGMSWGIENFYKFKSFQNYPFHLNDIFKIKFDTCSSWTTNKIIADSFAKNNKFWVILESTVYPENILIDTRLLNDLTLKKLYQSYQREVIVKPNTLLCKIHKIGVDKKDDLTIGFEGYDYKVWEEIYNSFKIFCKRYIENNKYNYSKLNFLDKNKRIFGDYIVEVPLLQLESYGVNCVVEIRYNEKFYIEFHRWGKRGKNDKSKNIEFETYTELLKYINQYTDFKKDISDFTL